VVCSIWLLLSGLCVFVRSNVIVHEYVSLRVVLFVCIRQVYLCFVCMYVYVYVHMYVREYMTAGL